MNRFFKHLFLTNRFFLFAGLVIALYIFSFFFTTFFLIAHFVLAVLVSLTLYDCLLLFKNKNVLQLQRNSPNFLSLGDENTITIDIRNGISLNLLVTIIDEIPFQFQQRNFAIRFKLAPKERKSVTYILTPLSRGEYYFNKINAFASTRLRLATCRVSKNASIMRPVFPSIQQMKKYELRSLHKATNEYGIKKIRRLGHSYEFDQIKNYVKGDDYRTINWKATGRYSELMVNKYENERAQQVYSIIDKSRTMQMSFNGLALMDYAINTSLVISNVAIQKHDKAGLITFGNKVNTLNADNGKTQMRKILSTLYNEKATGTEANYELLYTTIRKLIPNRALLILYTNFDSFYSLDRVLPLLRKISRHHLLLVVFFQDKEIAEVAEKETFKTEEIYVQGIAQQFIVAKDQIVQQLKNYGIQVVLTTPDALTINSINKYLEFKSRGLI